MKILLLFFLSPPSTSSSSSSSHSCFQRSKWKFIAKEKAKLSYNSKIKVLKVLLPFNFFFSVCYFTSRELCRVSVYYFYMLYILLIVVSFFKKGNFSVIFYDSKLYMIQLAALGPGHPNHRLMIFMTRHYIHFSRTRTFRLYSFRAKKKKNPGQFVCFNINL